MDVEIIQKVYSYKEIDYESIEYKAVIDLIDLDNIDKEKILFLDTETTGLSGGSGNFIFLYSFGYFEDKKFKIEQIFLKNFNSEKQALKLILDYFQKKEILISFNGKSFDIPLIKSRFILNQYFDIFNVIENKIHIDLYQLSRVLYKETINRFNLQTIEKFLLNFYRIDDLDSNLIPFEYFKFIRGEKSNINKILEHNLNDVFSLLKLFNRMEIDLKNESKLINYNNLIYYFIKRKKYYLAKNYLLKNKRFLDNEILFYYYVILLKKEKKFEKLYNLFEKYYEKFNFNEKLFVEFLKVLEHYKKDYKKALLLFKKEELKMQLYSYSNDDVYKRYKRIYQKFLLLNKKVNNKIKNGINIEINNKTKNKIELNNNLEIKKSEKQKNK